MTPVVVRSLSLEDQAVRRNPTPREISASSTEITQQRAPGCPEISPLHRELVWFSLGFLPAMGRLEKWPELVYVCF